MRVCVSSGLTEHGQPGGTRPHGGLDGLALKDGVVHQLHPLDPQVMLAGAVVADHSVARVACSHNRATTAVKLACVHTLGAFFFNLAKY